MDKREIKKLLVRAKKEPVNCALAQSDSQSGSIGLLLLDRLKPGKSLLQDLRKQFPTARNFCFGNVKVDLEGSGQAVKLP